MKIPASIRNAFDDQKIKFDRLKEKVDAAVNGIRKPRWHYESRVKTLQSYALKLESGRFRDPLALEDSFACTLVVANLAEVEEAEQLIRQRFQLLERRPNSSDYTHKRPDSFLFDDLRLYVALAADPNLPATGLESVRFEFQAKTFLQHAWSIATHDLVYKTDNVHWSKQRIAFQTKAMLEHAEVSILEAETLAASVALAKEDKNTKDIRRAIAIVRDQWSTDQLPSDVRRLAENVLRLAGNLHLSLDRVQAVLDAGKATAGSHPTNLSPYATLVQYLLSAEQLAMVKYLEGEEQESGGQRAAIVIPAEIDIPAGIDRSKWKNALYVG